MLIFIAAAGCRRKPAEPAPAAGPIIVHPPARPASRPATENAKADRPLPAVLAPPPRRLVRRPSDGGPKDPRPPVQLGTRFDIYDVLLPVGSVSRSQPFWKLVDEEKIDPGTYDVLRRNGIRVGVAPVSDWPAMRKLIDDVPCTTRLSSATGHEVTNLEISLQHDVLSQNLFVFLPDRTMVGRSFERCDNLFAVSFQQLPRRPGELRVTMAPFVRSTRKRLTFSAMGNEQEFAFTYPEKAIDVNLRADVPLDDVLIVAPSEEANLPSSVGRAFLTQDSPTEKLEHVLFMVPRMFRMEDDSKLGAADATNDPLAARPR